jgi:fermentation-respiration switch protein FrsA (DUF1100 family)
MKKLRVLSLHGYRGNSGILAQQLTSVASGLEVPVEWDFVDAPSLAKGDFGWWHARSHRGDPGVPYDVAPVRAYDGFEESRAHLLEILARRGPYDGVFGFSQGAALTGVLAALNARPGGPAFRFAIMVGGFLPADPQLRSLFPERLLKLPSLHLIGARDGIVPPQLSNALAARFERPVVVSHYGGHVIAANGNISSQVSTFLRARVTEIEAGALAPVVPLGARSCLSRSSSKSSLAS